MIVLLLTEGYRKIERELSHVRPYHNEAVRTSTRWVRPNDPEPVIFKPQPVRTFRHVGSMLTDDRPLYVDDTVYKGVEHLRCSNRVTRQDKEDAVFAEMHKTLSALCREYHIEPVVILDMVEKRGREDKSTLLRTLTLEWLVPVLKP